MSRRDNWSEDRIANERVKNKLRMAKKLECEAYRERVNAKRKERDRERKSADPELTARLNRNKKKYFEKRKKDPSFWEKRNEYLRRWRAERRINEEFEDFLTRIESAGNAEQI